jgi:FAD/FMN-containing dehydrogenase
VNVKQLLSILDCEVILPGHSEYVQGRRVWNAMIERHPAAIVRPASLTDVVRVVTFCAKSGTSLCIRGGGHNVAGSGTSDGGIVLDMQNMKRMSLDDGERRITVGGGTTWGELDRMTQSYELATTGGLVSTTGVGGLTLGGGIGWLMRKYGLACDNLCDATLVTADGQVRTVSADQDPELLWALRGGGGNFGVVTDLTYILHPLGAVFSGLLKYPIEAAPELLDRYREVASDATDDLTAFITFGTADRRPVVSLAICEIGNSPGSSADLKRLQPDCPPLSADIGLRSYCETQRMFDAGFPPGKRSYWKSAYMRRLDDRMVGTILRYASQPSSPLTTIDIEPLGGAVAESSEASSAFPHRHNKFNVLILTMWERECEDSRHVQWTKAFFDDLGEEALMGSYINYLSGDADAASVKSAYGESYQRLSAVKQRVDPTELFSSYHNISPIAHC